MPFITSLRRNYEQEVSNNRKFEVTGGDQVYTMGGYTIHTFTTTGEANLFIKNISSPSSVMNLQQQQLSVESLLVAGGGGGGSIGGGGGAGGMVFSNVMNLNVGTVPLSVGAGGSGTPGHPSPAGSNGGNSTFNGNTALGGAGSGSWSNSGPKPGGSGAGGVSRPNSAQPGSTATQPGQGLPQGGDGHGYPGARGGLGASASGAGSSNSITGAGNWTGGGGGGAGAAGGHDFWNARYDSSNGDVPAFHAGRKGGNGLRSTITGNSRLYAGGGGGGCHVSGYQSPVLTARGGDGGGGDGGSVDQSFGPGQRGQTGETNTGGGGGSGYYTGGGTGHGATGGPGIVVVRYLN